MKYKDAKETFGVSVVCGFKNQEIDKLENTDISVSSVFTIRPGPIEISTRFSQQMAKTWHDRVEHSNKQAKDLRQEYAHLKTSVWFELILLPKSVNPLDIHMDFPRFSGHR